MINYVTLRGANGCLRVALAPCGRHSCDPRKLDVQFFFGYSAYNVTYGYGCYSAPFEEPQVIFHSAGCGLQFVLPKTKLATTDIVQLGHAGWVSSVQVDLWQHEDIGFDWFQLF